MSEEKEMDETKVLEVLSNESYATNEEKAKALLKELAPHIIPKDKFNEVNAKYKALESERNAISSELDALKTKNMSAEELVAKEKAEYDRKLKETAKRTNKLLAENIFKNVGLNEADYKDKIDSLIGEDEQETLQRVEFVSGLLVNLKNTVTKENRKEDIQATPDPRVGGGEKGLSVLDALQKQYAEASEKGDNNLMASLTRRITEETLKQKK